MFSPGGSYAEFAVAWSHTTFHLPHSVSFEDAAALPLASMTAAIALYQRLALPQPWDPPCDETGPLVIYGASSSVGFYALQLALRSNIHPILCVAGRATEHIQTFIDPAKGDVVIDYREKTPEEIASALRVAAKGNPIYHALDAVSENGTPGILAQTLHISTDQNGNVTNGKGDKHESKGKKSKVTFVLAGHKHEIPPEIEQDITTVGSVHRDGKDFGFVWFRYMARGLREGWFCPQRVEVVPGGLGGIEKGLRDLKAGKASALKFVFRISETEGVRREEGKL